MTKNPCALGGVAADGAVGQRGRAAELFHTPPPPCGGVAADGAVGQRGRADSCCTAPPPYEAELPLTVQLVSVAVLRVPIAHAAAAGRAGGVAADGAVGQRERAVA